ncbi:MAG TPA: hypothetical protein VJP02_04485 [Candidatus Sulfotelmatobacter sp.]|nr:hypothetical protein [Candidatus Sulfotelmatobacter sp.]
MHDRLVLEGAGVPAAGIKSLGVEEHERITQMGKKQRSKRRDKFKGWRCDSCADMITSVQAGWVEWLASEDKHGNDILRGLRLVHREGQRNARNHKCRYDPLEEFRSGRTIVEGLPLERLVGADGLMILLSLLAEGELPHRETLELVKRVQIPGYELVRNLSPRGQRSQLLSPVLSHGYYLQSEIREMLGWTNQTSLYSCADH